MNQLRSILSQFKELYLRMNGTQRLSVGLFTGSVLLILVVFLMQATKSPSEQILFYNVGSKQASDITQKLKEMGVEWDYRNGGIFVGSGENIDKIKMSLAQSDLLPDDLAFDFTKIVNQNSMGLVKQERDRNFDIALSNEVAKVIRGMDSITKATVIIAKEEPSPLLIRHQKRTASVNVTVRGKRKLYNEEVKAIVRMISSSVKGLDPSRVSVTDSKGRDYVFNPDGGASEKFAMKLQEEQNLARKIEDYLLEFIPRVKATVTVDLDLKKHNRKLIDYQHKELNEGPSSTLISTLSEKEEGKTKEGSKGVVGAGTNSQADIKEGDGGTSVDQKKSRKQEEFKPSFVQDEIQFDNEISVVSVAVVIANRKLNPDFDANLERSEANQEFPEYKWEDEKAELIQQISNIVGTNPTKVSLVVREMMIEKTPVPPGLIANTMTGINNYKVYLGMVFFAAIGAFILIKMIKKAEPEEEIIPMPEFEEDVKEDDLPPLVEPEIDPKMRQVENRVKEIIEDDPQKAASVIRNWLSNE